MLGFLFLIINVCFILLAAMLMGENVRAFTRDLLRRRQLKQREVVMKSNGRSLAMVRHYHRSTQEVVR